MPAEGPRKVKASDIDTDEMLGFIRVLNEERQQGGLSAGWVYVWEVGERFKMFPFAVVHAKIRRLIHREVLNGCPCGCRGDLVVPDLDFPKQVVWMPSLPSWKP